MVTPKKMARTSRVTTEVAPIHTGTIIEVLKPMAVVREMNIVRAWGLQTEAIHLGDGGTTIMMV